MPTVITSHNVIHNENAFYCFKKSIEVKREEKSILYIFAEARYKLYINGELVAVGPLKGNDVLKYYDDVDVTPFIKEGRNEIEVQVLQLRTISRTHAYSHLTALMHDGGMVLSLWGNMGDCNVETDSSWQCAKVPGRSLKDGVRTYYVGMNEDINTDFNNPMQFEESKELCKLQLMDVDGTNHTEMSPWAVRKRTIPMLYFKEKEFAGYKNGIYDAGRVTTGYLRFKMSGKGTAKLTYAESMAFVEDGKIVKYDRCDENGVIIGDFDTFSVDGELVFESWWFRTFRFIKAELDGVTIESIDYIETGYPIEISDNYDFGRDDDNELFKISARTLECCMHETYEDCPYYEQLQYAMDTHIQMLFTYQLTNDDRLARKAIDDFASSYTFGSISQSRFPSNKPQYITGFALFFIYMLYEHYKRFSDSEFISKYMHIADGIITWFFSHMENGLVKRSNYWDFIDWATDFKYGQPTSQKQSGVYSLMLCDALTKTAELHSAFGTSCNYMEKAEEIKGAVVKYLYDESKNMYADSPDKDFFSQHMQIWAVLTGLAVGEDAKDLMMRAKELSCSVTFAYTYYLARAYEKAGIYEMIEETFDSMRALPSLNCTTMPEVPFKTTRSECHAWSALVLYEYTAKVLGVTVRDKKVYINPYTQNRSYAKGKVAVFGSFTDVEWKKNENDFCIKISLPEGVTAELTLPDGRVIENALSGEYKL